MRTLNILAPVRYPWRFNGPRRSRHNVENRLFVPFNKISARIEGITLFNPFPPKRFDLAHGFNRVPLGRTPFILGFESHLPRAFGGEDTAYFKMLSNRLQSSHCRGIVAISEYAKKHFQKQHQDKPWAEALNRKLTWRYPNFPIPDKPDAFSWNDNEPARIVFVGNHFGRKGGSVALRVAELANERGMHLGLAIISTMELGAASWIGPTRPGYWDEDMRRLKLPNVRYHKGLPNDQVLDIMRRAHFSLLPTFADTFGFSVIESMANHTPVIATRQGALPEFIRHNENGVLLALETNEMGDWAHGGRNDRESAAYESAFHAAVEQLAENTYTAINFFIKTPGAYMALRRNAKAAASRYFSDKDANEFWDDYYEKAVASSPKGAA